MAIDIPISESQHASHLGKCDCYLDDIVAVMINRPNAIKRWLAAAPLAVFLGLRPNAGPNEPIPRNPGLEPAKLLAEGTPAERQIVLGWLINTRLLLICVPKDKFQAWHGDIQEIMRANWSNNCCTITDLLHILGLGRVTAEKMTDSLVARTLWKLEEHKGGKWVV